MALHRYLHGLCSFFRMRTYRLLPLLLSLLAINVGLAAPKPNVLLICVDDLRPELKCFGVDYIHSPNIDALAARGRIFSRHYVQAPTCGSSRYTLLTGRYGQGGNGALFGRAKQIAKSPDTVPPSMPAYFRQHGYTTVSVGKVSHHPGGRGGKDWDDDTALEMPLSWDRHLLPSGSWQHPRGWMHGLANGEIRKNAKDMALIQALDGPDSIYPDGPNTEEGLRQLDLLAKDDKPFFFAFGILRPHLPFGAPKKYLDLYKDAELPATPHPTKPAGKTTWHGSGEFMKYKRGGRNPNTDADYAIDVRKHYAACVSYADAQVGRMLERLDKLGLRENTIIVLWGDHGWHLGEHAIWGKHALFEESLRSPMIISHPGIAKPGATSTSIVESLDIFPTLAELTKLPAPDFANGVSLQPILAAPDAPGHAAYSYHGKGKTIRTDSHRLIVHSNGHMELYDHSTPEAETKNLAETNAKLATQLQKKIEARLP